MIPVPSINQTKEITMTTIVAYRLKGQDHTANLVAKQGLFWLVTNDEKGEHKIPAKAVEETWEEGAEAPAANPVAAADPTPSEPDAEDEPTAPAGPSLAELAAAGPKLEAPKDTITLQELADDQGFEPRIARRQLRAAVAAGTLDHNKSEGWVFKNDRETIESVMKIITTKKRG